MRLQTLITLLVMMAVATVALPAHGSDLAALDSIPNDAMAVVIVPNMQQLSIKLSSFAGAVGLPLPVGDPLSHLKADIGAADGVRDEGALVVAVLDPEKYGGLPAAMFLPVNDFDTFVDGFADGATDVDGAKKIKLRDGESAWVVKKGNHALISRQKNVINSLTKVTDSIAPRFSGERKRLLSSGDAYFFVNMKKATAIALPAIEREMVNANAGPGIQQAKMAMQVFPDVLSQSETLDGTLQLNSQGVHSKLELGFDGSGSIAEFIEDQPVGHNKHLQGLFGTNWMMAVGTNIRLQRLVGISAEIMKQIASDPQDASKMDSKLLIEMTEAAKVKASLQKSTAFALNSNPPGGGFISIVGLTQTSDPQALLAEGAKVAKLTNQMYQSMGMPISLVFNENIEKVGELPIHTLKLEAAAPGPNATPESMQAAMVVNMALAMGSQFLGPDGVTVRYAAVDDEHVITTVGGDRQTMEAAIEACKSGVNLGNDALIQQVSGKLPENRNAELYLHITRLMQMGLGIGSMFMPQLAAVQVDTDVPPAAMSVSIRDRKVAVDLVVPASQVKATFAGVMQIQRQVSAMSTNATAANEGF